MSIAPFSPHPAPAPPGAQGGSWRTRLAVASATVGIAATLLAYAISPGLRHAVSHAEHSVGHAVSRVFDRDAAARKHAQRATAHKSVAAHRKGPSTHAKGKSRSQPGTSATSSGGTTRY
ncbi:MAG TPA: hypothetical protein VH115_07490 [Solirubrobacteraceae bacterium]|nr:hypothetical protein [Solirubrobacteraceae bacterium]